MPKVRPERSPKGQPLTERRFPILGEIGAAQFLAEYWQRKPLLIRNALPGFQSPIEPDELAGLSLEEDIESRIVIEQGAACRWELHQGPFTEETFRQLPEENWTLLVQAVDLWLPEVKQLLEHFTFLPPWRVDDIMVSYAPTGGSVGPHFDYYDVFLLQGLGQRRWQIGGIGDKLCDEQSPREPGSAVRILKDYPFEQEWVLEPGDMLYLPPQVAHCGTALGDCITYSIGFRAPSAAEMLGDLANELLSQPHSPHYKDPQLTPAMASEQISSQHIAQVRELLTSVLDDEALLADWFARYMTTPKYADLTEITRESRKAIVNGSAYQNGIIE